eukprot:TRINITY_DN3608_c0_g3_i1.p1 TRINITY_DN3608_c0_g3~~TRINITY_DN3608_c0_g3_i1.p1  ORF type:complete len:751 (+),score=38.55 TRINITY_DN3608_c0_g3_i1:116-2368(+)
MASRIYIIYLLPQVIPLNNPIDLSKIGDQCDIPKTGVIKDTDLHIFVKDHYDVGGGPCYLEPTAWNRSIVGVLYTRRASNSKLLFLLYVQKVLNILGFSESLYNFFTDETGVWRNGTGIWNSTNAYDKVLVIKPLLTKAQAIMNSSFVNGVRVFTSKDNLAFVYTLWSCDIEGDIMSQGLRFGQRLSALTLAFLESTGWYLVDYSRAEPLPGVLANYSVCDGRRECLASNTYNFRRSSASSYSCSMNGDGNIFYTCGSSENSTTAPNTKCVIATLLELRDPTFNNSASNTSIAFDPNYWTLRDVPYKCIPIGDSFNISFTFQTETVVCADTESGLQKSVEGYKGVFVCPNAVDYCKPTIVDTFYALCDPSCAKTTATFCKAGICEDSNCNSSCPVSAGTAYCLQSTCFNYTCSPNCTENGVCTKDGCKCNPGYAGATCDYKVCDSQYCNYCEYNVNCTECTQLGLDTKKCVNPTCPADCSGNGDCKRAKCNCKLGFTEDNCGKSDPCDPRICSFCEGGKCLECSQKGIDSNTCVNPQCPSDCVGRTECWRGKCACKLGYTGATCDTLDPCDPRICSYCEAGKCLECAQTGLESKTCVNPPCSSNCSGKSGECKRGKCECKPGYRGDTCEESFPCDPRSCAYCEADKCLECTKTGLDTGVCVNPICTGCYQVCWRGACYCSINSNTPSCTKLRMCDPKICDSCNNNSQCLKCKDFAYNLALCSVIVSIHSPEQAYIFLGHMQKQLFWKRGL